MRRGTVGNFEAPAILVDYRCFAFEVQQRVRFGFVNKLLNAASRPQVEWEIHPFVPQFLARNSGRMFDVYVVAGVENLTSLGAALSSIQGVRNIHNLGGHDIAIRQIEVAGYACLLTPDPNLAMPDRSVQLFGGLTHRFV